MKTEYDETRDSLIARLADFDFTSYVISRESVMCIDGQLVPGRDVTIYFRDDRQAPLKDMPKHFAGSSRVASSAEDGKE